MNSRLKNTAISTAVLSGVLVLGGAVAWQVGVPQQFMANLAGAKADPQEEGNGGKGQETDGRPSAVVNLAPEQVKLAEIASAAAAPGNISHELVLAGEVKLNEDRLVHIAPRVTGIIRESRKTLGDAVVAGEVMVVIDSRELADAKSAHLTAKERLSLAQATFDREERLFKSKVSAEQEFLEAKRVLAEANIEMRSADQKLHALGFSDKEIESMGEQHNLDLTGYEIKSPLAGTVIEKHVAPGEHVQAEADLYTVCDLSSLWVIASVNAQDVAQVKKGQAATFSVDAHPGRTFQGQVTHIAEVMDEQTRTLKIRITVDNADRLLKAGMFARVALAVESRQGAVTVPSAAIQSQKDRTFVFLDLGNGKYERREVKLGLQSAQVAEVLGGIALQDRVVVSGGFTLKSELDKASFEAD
jgi:cobalt-zinc-cadmium efflux system membrane fusion protein